MTSKKKLFLRADASEVIGHGHVIRCLSLAEMAEWDSEPVFIVRDCPEQLVIEIKKSCDFIKIPHGIKAQDEPDYFAENFMNSGDIIVLDGYNFSSEYQKKLKINGFKTVYIDDLHQGIQVADLVINHAPNVDASLYQRNSNTTLLLGLEYLILRKQFRQIIGSEIKKIKQVNDLVICFGGADPNNVTLKAVKAFFSTNLQINLHVITGSSYLFKQELIHEVNLNNRVKLYENLTAEEMARLLYDVQAVICPASTISLEALVCGNLLITGLTAPNQSLILNGLEKFKQVCSVKDFELITANELSVKMSSFLEHIPYFDTFELSKNPYPKIFRLL
jgi:UDP-2,4-diacetamido-2,4,6-trideoxy-beta-L-altropyranose hydrolase